MDWVQTTVGALIGAFAGTMLGAITSYGLWLLQRRRERRDRRAELFASLKWHLQHINRREHGGNPDGTRDPIPMPGIDDLFQLLRGDSTEVVRAAENLRVTSSNYNAYVAVTNAARATGVVPKAQVVTQDKRIKSLRQEFITSGDKFVKAFDAGHCAEPIKEQSPTSERAFYCILDRGHKGGHSHTDVKHP